MRLNTERASFKADGSASNKTWVGQASEGRFSARVKFTLPTQAQSVTVTVSGSYYNASWDYRTFYFALTAEGGTQFPDSSRVWYGEGSLPGTNGGSQQQSLTLTVNQTLPAGTYYFWIACAGLSVYGQWADSEDIAYATSGLAHISNGSTFDSYMVYIDNGTGWDAYLPYVDNGTSWDIMV